MLKSSLSDVRISAEKTIEKFSENKVFLALENKKWSVYDYHELLVRLFYQVYQGSMSFAAAAANCPPRLTHLREYLVGHAHEEMLHYKWILDDLTASGYKGKNPYDVLPAPAVLAYTSFNTNNALHMPAARLASSVVLEGIGQKYGAYFGDLVKNNSTIDKSALTFFYSHGETDKTHIVELWNALEESEFLDHEIKWMEHTSFIAGEFYREIWSSSVSGLQK